MALGVEMWPDEVQPCIRHQVGIGPPFSAGGIAKGRYVSPSRCRVLVARTAAPGSRLEPVVE